MTRDQAIKVIFDTHYPNQDSDTWCREWSGRAADTFVALGMLKLDEPVLMPRSSPEYKLYDSMYEHITGLDFLPFKKVIEAAGLKIVEK